MVVLESTAARVVALVGGSHFVHHSYFMLLPPIYAPLRSELGLTDPQLGLALGTLGFVVTALQLPFGHLSDARSRSLVLALSLGVGALGAAMTALAVDFRTLLLSQVVLGVGIAGHHPAHYPLIGAATTADQRGRAYSVHGFAGALGFATPPAVVAGAATLGFDWRVAVGTIALFGALYALFAVAYVSRRVDRSITHASVDEDGNELAGNDRDGLVAGLSRLFRSRPIVALTVLWFVSSMAAWGIKQYTGTLLTDLYTLGPAPANVAVSAMLAVGAVLIFAGGWLTDRRSAWAVLVGGYVALIVVGGVLALSVLPALAAIALALLLSATVDSGRPARAALADRFSDARSVGKSFGLLTIGISGGSAVAPPILGVVVERSGVAAAFLVIVGFSVVALALTGVVFWLDSDE